MNIFDLPYINETDAKNSNPQLLAFIGDAVFSLYIRHKVVLENKEKIKELHSHTTHFVKASEQSLFSDKLHKIYNEEELAVFRRARNYKTANIAKNAKLSDYKKATGFEAVLGYLYLSGKIDRLNELLKECEDENWRKECCFWNITKWEQRG